MSYRDFRDSLRETKELREFRESDSYLRDIWYPQHKKNIIGVKPIPSGNCMLCDQEKERVSPVLVDLCPTCARKIYERNTVNEKIHFKEKLNYNGVCYLCKRKFVHLFEMNIRVCSDCLFKYLKRNYGEIKIKRH